MRKYLRDCAFDDNDAPHAYAEGKLAERKEFMSEVNITNCNNPDWGGLAFKKVAKKCSKLMAEQSKNASLQGKSADETVTGPQSTATAATAQTATASQPSGDSAAMMGTMMGAMIANKQPDSSGNAAVMGAMMGAKQPDSNQNTILAVVGVVLVIGVVVFITRSGASASAA